MKLSFQIAWKFLTSSKAQTVLIITGIAIGISVQLFIGLLIQGLQKGLIQTTIGSSSQITIEEKDETIKMDDPIIEKLEEEERLSIVSLVLQKDAFLSVSEQDYTVLVRGIQFDKKQDLAQLEDKLIEGRLPLEDNEIILGQFFDEINLEDVVEIQSFEKEPISMKVVGIFDFGNATVNEKQVYTNLKTLQRYLQLENQVSSIEMQLVDIFSSRQVKEELDIPQQFTVTTWEESNASLLSALSSQSLSSVIIQVFVVISVALGISSVLIVSVTQKSKQIGILKAMGLNNNGVSLVFVAQGLILGVLGSVMGIILGFGLLEAFSRFAVDEAGNSIITIYYTLSSFTISMLVGVLSAVVASLIPAQKSKKLTVMEVINNG